MTVICIVLAWVISLSPFGTSPFVETIPAPSISQNELLLEKLNLSNVMIFCPDPFIYSAGKQLCQVKCGTAFLGYDHYSKRCLYTIVGIINIVISVAAFIRIIKIRKELKFEHHPIFIGVIVNLIQSFVIGIPDIIGSDIFYCENKDIDFDFLNENPPIQLHIIGALVSLLGISNRLWFIMAIALIFLSVSFPLKDLFRPRRNRIVIGIVEIAVCFVYPLVGALSAFIPFSGYRLSDSVLLPVHTNRTLGTIFSYAPHLLISAVTITIIVLIIYKIHSKLQNGSDETGKKQSMHPLEKRLLSFSVVYFSLISIICVSLVINFIKRNHIEEMNEFLAMLTLQSPYLIQGNDANSSFMLNQTSTLLTPKDQLSVQDRTMPFFLGLSDIAIRVMFIFTMPMLSFSNFNVPFIKKMQ